MSDSKETQNDNSNFVVKKVTLSSEGKKYSFTYHIHFDSCDIDTIHEIAAREIRTRTLDKVRVNSTDKDERIVAKRSLLKVHEQQQKADGFVRVNASEFATQTRTRKTIDTMSIDELVAMQERINRAINAMRSGK